MKSFLDSFYNIDVLDKDLAMARLRLLSAQATGGFMRHVLARPASAAQQDRAQELLAASEQEAAELAAQIGDPDAISDKHGDLPAERRERHLDEHMTFFRRPLQREWSSGQQRRFRPLFRLWRSHKLTGVGQHQRRGAWRPA